MNKPIARSPGSAKAGNIVDMGLTFTAMMRIFKKDTKQRIARRLLENVQQFDSIKSQKDYDEMHRGFCLWFIGSLKTAEKKHKLTSKVIRASARPSYGQAAKVIDIVAKVVVHYCHLPNQKVATKLVSYLHSAIDNPILKHLKKKYKNRRITATSIASINKTQYQELQALVEFDIKGQYEGKIDRVTWDDIQWSKLNRLL